MTDLAGLIARTEIVECCTRLHWYYDRECWDDLEQLFTPVVAMPTVFQVTEPAFDVETYLAGYEVERADVMRGLRRFKEGLVTQHLITGHMVTLGGDATAVCVAHSINVHLPVGPAGETRLVAHGNEYRFDLVADGGGWLIRGWVPQVRWSRGDDASHDVAAKQAAWLGDVRPDRA